MEEGQSVTETGKALSGLGPDIVSGSKRSESEDSSQSIGGYEICSGLEARVEREEIRDSGVSALWTVRREANMVEYGKKEEKEESYTVK